MAHPQLDSLLNTCLDFAHTELHKHGEFYPFGASIDINGNIVLNTGWTEEEIPKSQEIIDILEETFRNSAESKEIVAYAICSDVKLPESDAIRCDLGHKNGECVLVLEPYIKENDEYAFEELSAQHSATKIF